MLTFPSPGVYLYVLWALKSRTKDTHLNTLPFIHFFNSKNFCSPFCRSGLFVLYNKQVCHLACGQDNLNYRVLLNSCILRGISSFRCYPWYVENRKLEEHERRTSVSLDLRPLFAFISNIFWYLFFTMWSEHFPHLHPFLTGLPTLFCSLKFKRNGSIQLEFLHGEMIFEMSTRNYFSLLKAKGFGRL